MGLVNYILILLVGFTVCQYPPGVPPPGSNDIKFHEPTGTPPPTPVKGPPPRQSSYRHQHADIRLKMDDNKLLMQYFRKHDTDKNHKLDGLELLKAIAGMEADDHHHDDDEDEPKKEEEQPSGHAVNLEHIIPVVDSILEQDDKVII